MAVEVLIIRIVPSKPVDADTFRTVLSDLKIEVYDLSLGESGTGTLIGIAEGLLDVTAIELKIKDQSPNVRRLEKGIWQHWTPILVPQPPLPIDTTQVTRYSVASAVVLINKPTDRLEYNSYDLRLNVTRKNSLSISSKIEYNASPVVSLNTDPPVVQRQLNIFNARGAAYVFVPAIAFSNFDPDTTAIPDSDGSVRPWQFTRLVEAVNRVVTQDRLTSEDPETLKLENRDEPLTGTQSKHIAAEIVWNRIIYPPPQAPVNEKLYEWYTGSGSDEPGRKQFEGEFTAYAASQNSEVARLANFIFAASAAFDAERRTRAASEVGLEFPFQKTTAPSTSTPQDVSTYRVALSWGSSTAGFVVPAAFFYVLGAKLPMEVSRDQRYSAAISSNESQNLTAFLAAVEAGIIGETAVPLTETVLPQPTVNSHQVARRLVSLGSYARSLPTIEIGATANSSSSMPPLLHDWLSYTQPTNGMVSGLWEGSSGAIADHPIGYLLLVLCVITSGSVDLMEAIIHARPDGLGVGSVAGLVLITEVEWKQFFGAAPIDPTKIKPHPELLPEFTMPGTVDQRAQAMIRRIQTFFWLEPQTATAGPISSTQPAPVFDSVNMDIIAEFISLYEDQPGTFTFDNPLDETRLDSVTNQLFPSSDAARDRLRNAVKTINDLTMVTKGTGDIRFSLMESLYARGLTSAESITALSLADFRRALIGTPAFSSAAVIKSNAQSVVNTPERTDPSSNGFTPINPDGNLVNCIPPDHLSPLGPVEYLHELLTLPTVYGTLANAISSRRSGLDDFLASESNLATEVPLIDLVNENLESIASHPSAPTGQIHNTGGTPASSDNESFPRAHPEHSSPAVKLGNPAAYENLRQSFDSPILPYSQNLDVSRSYLETIGTSRFQVMRKFREDTTEFPIPVPDDQRPDDFEKQRWHLPVDIKTALEYLHISLEEFDLLYSGKPLSVQVLQTMLGVDGACSRPPTEQPPIDTPPTEEPPVDEPPVDEPPVDEPPVDEPPVDEPPVEEPPVREPPVTPPDDTPPPVTGPRGCTPSNTAAPTWKADQSYALAELVRFRGRLYKCRQAHHSLAEWFPTQVPALWVTPLPCGLTEWHVQTEYVVGSRVRYDGHVYKCRQAHASDAPNWTPRNTPALWTLEDPISTLFTASLILSTETTIADGRSDSCSESEWITSVCRLDRFISHTGLSYCEFLDVVKAQIVPLPSERGDATYPDCEPCCLKGLSVRLDAENGIPQLRKLVIFIRLWRILKATFPGMLTIAELATICRTLNLFQDASGQANPGFIRQLAALVMSHCYFRISFETLIGIYEKSVPPADCLVDDILGKLENVLLYEPHCTKRPHGFKKILLWNLESLGRLAGFLPPTHWFDCPTNTIRFLEVLSRIYESDMSIGEVIFLFTDSPHLQGDDPFPMQDSQEAADDPLELAEDSRFSLWELRKKLFSTEATERTTSEWSWRRILSALDYLGIDGRGALQTVAQYFFPFVLSTDGSTGGSGPGRFHVALANDNPRAWDSLPCGPLRYEDGSLYLVLPARDSELINQLRQVRRLNPVEQQAIQTLYFTPRAIISPIAFIFEDFDEALAHLICEDSDAGRWHFFQCQFTKFYARCEIIVSHLAGHVAQTAGSPCEEDTALALEILKHLTADENRLASVGSSWEDQDLVSTSSPELLWSANLSATSFAAILGLLGTGPLEEYHDDDQLVWRNLRSSLSFFGNTARDKYNWPVPTILPSLQMSPSLANNNTITVRNGLAIRDNDDVLLGGPTRFTVVCCGSLLVERRGNYTFQGKVPILDGIDECSQADCSPNEWVVTIERGQKVWTILQRGCELEEGSPNRVVGSLWLRRGVYRMKIHFKQKEPVFDDSHVNPVHTGLQILYCGPDTDDKLITIPRQNLFCDSKTAQLGQGIVFQGKDRVSASNFLSRRYYSTLRDIRRTYQRAFKALLFSKRLCLSAIPEPCHDHQFEINFLLSHPTNFAGFSYYRPDGSTKFLTHRAGFDFNLLPVVDPYFSPDPSSAAVQDIRAHPSAQRQAALFDWFERLCQYINLRQEHRKLCRKKPLWHMFVEAESNGTAQPDQLLLQIGIDVSASDIVLTYYTPNNKERHIQSADLIDERWAFRVWQAGAWLQQVQSCFYTPLIETAKPAHWASDDPGRPVQNSTLSGNANLITFVSKTLGVSNPTPDVPRGLRDLTKLNNVLRLRARSALIAYLCSNNRVSLDVVSQGTFARTPLDLSNLLLMDVDCSVDSTVARVEDLANAVQTLVQRASLSLEPNVSLPQSFFGQWKRRYGNFQTWQSWKKQTVYAENWVQWKELSQAKKSEGFRLLTQEMSRATHTIPLTAESNNFQNFSDQYVPDSCLDALQNKERLAIQNVTSKPDEGLAIMGTPSFSGRPSWVAPVSGRSLTPSSSATRLEVNALGTPESSAQNSGDRDLSTVNTNASLLAPGLVDASIPLWLRAAIRMGTRFIRVPAAGMPPGLSLPAPWSQAGDDTCCCAPHDKCPLVDEYWFWISDASQFKDVHDKQNADFGSTSQIDSHSDWEEAAQLPKLLQWPETPTIYLYWTRYRYDQYEPLRSSDEGVEVNLTSGVPQLEFKNRGGDSLLFSVTGVVPRPGYPSPEATSTADTGFRYDIVTDRAVVIPQLEAATDTDNGTSSPYPAPLGANPFFVFFSPGSPSIPLSNYITSIFIAEALSSRCCFEEALRWCKKVYDPVLGSNAWEICPKPSSSSSTLELPSVVVVSRRRDTSCCPQSTTDPSTIRQRAVTLLYLDILLQFCDSQVSRSSKDSFQQALVIINSMDQLLGEPPETVQASDIQTARQTILSFVASPAPLNPRLVAFYSNVKDRRSQLRDLVAKSQSSKYPEPGALFKLTGGISGPGASCAGMPAYCRDNGNHYRFSYLLPRALEAIEFLRGLGNNLLSALEKGDAEYLSSLRITHENQIQALGLDVRQNTWRESDWQLQSIEKTMENAQTRLRYFQNLVTRGLNNGETTYKNDTILSTTFRTSSTTSDGIAQGMSSTPDMWFGVAGMAGTPLNFQQIPVGVKLAHGFSTAARILNTLAELQTSQAGLSLTEAGWDRRQEEWQHTIDTTKIEIEQIKRQLLSSKRRCAISLKELNNHQRQVEQSREIHDFVRDKFTKQDLYLFLQTETVRLYRQAHELATTASRDALYAFLYERGDYGVSSPWSDNRISSTIASILNDGGWESLREGLTVGDRLEFALRTLDRSYLQHNAREYELTRHISLRLLFPVDFLRLKLTGRCTITLPEWLFDLDYPGHYMRRIKNVSLTIPCVTGPYTGVRCRLRLLSSSTRVDPSLHIPSKLCCRDAGIKCSPGGTRSCYTVVDSEDPRLIRQYHHSLRPDRQGGMEIATSSGQADAGMFDTNMRSDERYLPFEFCGVADSTWSIDLPQENNQFDLHTLSDAVLHINYTAREGGEALRQAASASVQKLLPDQGLIYLDAKEDLAGAWYKCFSSAPSCERRCTRHPRCPHCAACRDGKLPHQSLKSPCLMHNTRQFNLSLSGTLFPFIPRSRIPACGEDIRITRIDIFVETLPTCSHENNTTQACACSELGSTSGRHMDLVFFPTANCSSHEDVPCIIRFEWTQSNFHGILNLENHQCDDETRAPSYAGLRSTMNPGQDVNIGTLCFPAGVSAMGSLNLGRGSDTGEPSIIIDRIFFIVHYAVVGLEGNKGETGVSKCQPRGRCADLL